MASLVSLRNVIKRYVRGEQTIEVLHQLDLKLPVGQLLALMGPSGSGKTTVHNLIGGLDRPTAGGVIAEGERNVELPLLLTSLSGAQRQRNVAAAPQLVGFAERAKHKSGELSGGQQQRIA